MPVPGRLSIRVGPAARAVSRVEGARSRPTSFRPETSPISSGTSSEEAAGARAPSRRAGRTRPARSRFPFATRFSGAWPRSRSGGTAPAKSAEAPVASAATSVRPASGTGHVAQSETVKIKIPEGTENGGTIRIPKKGQRRRSGRPDRRSLRHGARHAPSVFRAARQRHPRRGSDHGQGGLRGRRDRGPDDPRHGGRARSPRARRAARSCVCGAREFAARGATRRGTTSTPCA